MLENKSFIANLIPVLESKFKNKIVEKEAENKEFFFDFQEPDDFWFKDLKRIYLSISDLDEIPCAEPSFSLKDVPYEIEGYYIRMTKSRERSRYFNIHIGEKKWINQKHKKLINEIINNTKIKLASWQNSLDIWGDSVVEYKQIVEEYSNVADLLEF